MNFIERADLCKKEIDSVRPFEGHMLEQVKNYIGYQLHGHQMR